MAQRPSVTVLGSLNTDISLLVPHLPGPGETVLAAAAAIFGAGGKEPTRRSRPPGSVPPYG